MSVINDVLIAVIGMTDNLNLYAPIIIGSLPTDNGLCMAIAAGGANSTFLDKGMQYVIDVVFNGKHENQQTISDTLNNVHQALTQTKNYPQTSTYQITNIETSSTPTYLDREANKQWLYGSSLRIKFYYRKDD